ncbi:MAG: ImmA/IrrE family metallo-endopeptidase [Crocosphaera sp.]|nr:ImmA/IrrE family metallo-endopeptidase [Crocosphaera sp.]
MQIFKPFRFIPKKSIEKETIQILQQIENTPNYQLKFPIDASRIAEFLGLDVVWDSIPDDEKGVIAARILPLEKLIEINELIPELRGGFGESTIAHEIGHWVLHIDQNRVKQCLSGDTSMIKVDPLLCRNEVNLSGIEWQAQYFASCLLMPRFKLKEICHNRNLQQWKELYTIADELGVTISNLVHRLKDLGWIELKDNSRQIELRKRVA